MHLTEAEDIQKSWQEYTKELYKKDLHNPDNHNGVITDLEPDILECEVKRAMDCSQPGSSVHGIFQARVLEWGAIASASKVGWHVNFQPALTKMTEQLKWWDKSAWK